jgi:malonyl-CoA/methylmalonyl-CoA synthetase
LDFVVAYLGVLRAGATALLANPAYTEAELELLVSDSGASLALAADAGLDHLVAVAGRQPKLRAVRSLDELGGTAGVLASARPVEPAPREPGTPAILAYTSGTTGKPKAVPLSDGNLLASARAVMLAWRWRPDDVLVHALPLFHQHGLGGVHAALLSGSRTVVRSRFDPRDMCGAIAAQQASVLFAVPSMYLRLVEWEGIEQADLTNLRLLVSGSAPLSPPLAERMAELAGQPPLERYGLTESGLDVSNPYNGKRRPGQVGLRFRASRWRSPPRAGTRSRPEPTAKSSSVVPRSSTATAGIRRRPPRPFIPVAGSGPGTWDGSTPPTATWRSRGACAS